MKRILYILLLLSGTLSAQYTIHNPYEGVSFDSIRKSNLHMHTCESDGNQSVEERIEGNNPPGRPYGYADYNYEILSITDHDSYEDEDCEEEYSGIGTTWPWGRYSGMSAYVPVNTYIWNQDTSSIYYDNHDGILAIRGNELTACQQDNNYYTHINSYFSDYGTATCPTNGFDEYFDSIQSKQGMAVFNHPGRHAANAAFYTGYFDTYGTDMIVGIEICNFGDYRPVQNPRVLWDSINATRDYDDLVWGFSNSDVHQTSYDDTTDIQKNYNIHYIDTLTETAFRTNLINGAFTAHWAGTANDFGGDLYYPTATLTDVTVGFNYIKLTAIDYDSIRWFDNSHDSILTGDSINVFGLTTNFVRAEIYNDSLITYTQPFGLADAGDIGGQYYVSPTGNDDSAGTYLAPFATLQKAVETADAGDTVYFRGGTYTPTSRGAWGTSDVFYYYPDEGYGNTGTVGNRIRYVNYPGETPVFDFSEMDTISGYITAFYIRDVHFVDWVGLTFQNVPIGSTGPHVQVWEMIACSNFRLERLVVQDCAGVAYRYLSGIGDDVGIATDSTYIINCDAFRNQDVDGNHADGWKFDQDKGAYFYFEGNRAMFNSDDGFDISGSALRVFYNNWAFGTGWVTGGNANGFKTGTLRDTVDYPSVIMIRNISAYNHDYDDGCGGFGFDLVDYQVSDTSYRRANARFYNNIAYKSDKGFAAFSNPLWDFRNSEYRNNISYGALCSQDGTDLNVQILTYEYPESHNTWDWVSGGFNFVDTDSVTMDDDTWLTVDSTTIVNQMMGARGSDGSLPTLTTAFQLDPNSDLIDAGTTYRYSEISNVPGVPDLGTLGSAPDIGAVEYGESGETLPIAYSGRISVDAVNWIVFRGTTTNDGGGTISEQGIVISESENPTTSDTNLPITRGCCIWEDAEASTTYYWRFFSTNEAGTAYGTEYTFTTE